MRYLRAKHIRKSLRQYQFLCGIKEPYKMILDGNFIAMCVQMKVDLVDRVPKFLQIDSNSITYYVPRAVLKELADLGPEMKEAYDIAKTFKIVESKRQQRRQRNNSKNNSENSTSQVTEAILEMIGSENKGHYFVATQETGLRVLLREIPGVPLVYLNRSVLVFEDISKATLRVTRNIENSRSKLLTPEERAQVALIKKKKNNSNNNNAAATTNSREKRKRGAKGPNPLSCKPKVKKKIRSKK